MSLEIVPFEDGFVEQAAALLAGAHATGGWTLADADVARRLVTAWQGSGPAVAALRDGRVTAFMAATGPAHPGGQSARVRLSQHACAPPGRRGAYRSLYAALSGRLTGLGAFEHALVLPAHDQDAITCFFELGFGLDQVRGFQSVTRAGAPATAGVRVRAARPEDLPRLLDLTVELQGFHAGAPMLRPALVDLRAIRDGFRAALDDDRRALLVAEEHGHPVGLMQVGPDNLRTGAATIGMAVVTASARSGGVGTALLSAVEGWAGQRGFGSYGAEWSSANLVSDAFWRGRGMVPAQFTLTRLIDSRVAWADATLSYRHFAPEPP
ncbi:GNAT family N-acetyltransferase [Nonomuraea sp. MG754425]|uniref:GNAT family N-acetyltransferase n=1 Tax=Nonomuraea sp. MG754425 TaxID=2570319 RepID=UPI001F3E2556|nr:GNAT family N-acetyltransferase [Nonomuraea sp. MG754425]MCF6474638.1 GNAT family N-acetyltransferase [Nonomuraea sp. MG754425]